MTKNKTTVSIVVSLLAFAFLSGRALATGESELSHKQPLSSETVWRPEVEELQWSDIRPAEIDKSWLDSDYSDQDFVVARGLAGSTKRRAIEAYILPRIEKKLHLDNDWQRRVAVRRIQYEMKRTPVIVDRFQQTFFKQAGDEQIEAFTREALLVDISDDNLARLVRPVRRDIHRRQHARTGALTFASVVVSIACVVCWVGSRFFNRFTQGYYVWPIRLVTAAVLLTTLGLTAGFTFSILRAL